MRAIELVKCAYIEIATGSLQEGLCAQLWLRPAALEVGAVVLKIGDCSLEIGERGALRLRGGAATLTAPGALTAGRWTAVTVTIAADGAATVSVDGALAAVGGVPAPVGAGLRLGDPARGAAFAVAELRVSARPDAAPRLRYTVVDGALVDAERGPAAVVGAAQVVAADELPGLRAARPGAMVWDADGDALELPALTADLTGGVTLEAWVRPRLTERPMIIVDLARPRGEHRVGLMIDPWRRGLYVLVADRRIGLDAVIRGDAWQHVCATVDARGLCKIYVDARLVHEQAGVAVPAARDGVRTACWIGADGGKTAYRGEVAELRVWQGALAGEAIAERWLRRACGDEAGLVACHHLDEIVGEGAIDASPRRLHARAHGGLAVGDGVGLPLRARGVRGGLQVGAAGKLLLDHLPASLFPEARIDMGRGPDLKVPTAARYGTVQGSLVRCAVYEVTFAPRAADGRAWTGELELRVDAEIKVLRSDGGPQRLVDWKPGVVERLKVGDSGRVRVKVLAGGSLDCPTVRVRMPGMDADCWALVRPADAAQQQMRQLTAGALQRPPQGKKSVLDPKLSAKDADALARFMRDAAGGLPTPAPSQGGKKGLLDDIADGITGAAGAVGDAFVDLGKDVEKLAMAGVDETRKLAAKAAGTAAQAGEAVIRGCIKDARKLAVDGSAAVWGGVQVIGERVVDGVKKTFRTVVAGVLDVVDAITAFLERIGASIMAFIEFLAMLFDWDKFLKKSDELYDEALRQYRNLAKVAGSEIRKIPARIDDLVAMPANSELADRTIGEAFGIDGAAELLDIDQLRWLVDTIDEAFRGSPPKVERKEQPGPAPVIAGGQQAHAGVIAAYPKSVLEWPWDPLDLRIGELLAAPQKMWAAGRPVVTPMADWLADQTESVLDRAKGILTSRLAVPYLTDVIEAVILRGRKLDFLRLVALVGAVPAVMCGDALSPIGGSSSSGGGGGSATKSLMNKGPDANDDAKEDETERRIRWTQVGFNLVNSLLLIGRAGAEWAENLGAMWTLNFVSGATMICLAGLDFGLASRLGDPAAIGFTVTHALLGLFGGAWMIASTAWGIEALAAGEEKLHDLVDGIVEGVIGGAELLTMSFAAGFKQTGAQETGRGLGFLLANWTLRGLYRLGNGLDNSNVTFAHAATTACAVAIFAVDMTDATWTVVDGIMG